jgi:hypothetical protein
MSYGLYIVHRRNGGRFPIGSYWRLFDDGFERCKIKQENGRVTIVGYEGIIIPESELKPFVVRVQKKGLDKRW